METAEVILYPTLMMVIYDTLFSLKAFYSKHKLVIVGCLAGILITECVSVGR